MSELPASAPRSVVPLALPAREHPDAREVDGTLAAAPESPPAAGAAPCASAEAACDPKAPALQTADLVRDHHAALYRYAYRLTGSAADAEDLTQQTFLTAHSKLGQIRDAASAQGWLFTILRNQYLKTCRRRVPQPAASLQLDMDALPGAAVDDDIDREQLQAAINELPDEFKLVLLSFYFEDCSYREIAARFDLPAGTVMSRLSRAKNHLRARLFGSEMAREAAKTARETND